MPDSSFDDEASAATGSSNMPHDGRRQHKYSTKDQKPDNPWKRWCCMALCCLVCIAIMILLTLWLQHMFDPDEDEDWSDDTVNATDDDLVGTAGVLTGAASVLPQTMDYIEDVCSEQRLGQDDRTTCEQACGPAKDCCDPFANGGNSTCFEGDGAGCFSYAKCHSLDGFLDPAHNNLDRICSKASIEINREDCVNACKAVECCFNPTESCVASNFQGCMDYAACQNLKEDSIDVAPTDLDDRCGKQAPDCERSCKEALGCSNPNSAAFRDNFITCLSYSACTGNSDTKIVVAPIYSRVEQAPSDLDDKCSRSGLRSNGPEECLKTCSVAQCCWDTGAGGCFGEDPLGCLEYERCSVLLTPEYAGLEFPPAPAAPAAAPDEEPAAEEPVEEEPVVEEPVAGETLAPEEETPAVEGNETATDAETRRQLRTV